MKRLLIGLCCALGISAWALGDGSFVAPISIPATTCSNQFIRSIAAATGIGTCATVSLTADVTGVLPLANGGVSAPVTYTPSPSCGTSTFTVNSARYSTANKWVLISLDVTVASIGTCAASTFAFTAPITANSSGGLVGRESAIAGTGINCNILGASATVSCQLATGNVLLNERFVVSGAYEGQ